VDVQEKYVPPPLSALLLDAKPQHNVQPRKTLPIAAIKGVFQLIR
jgi:hypothetical protein